MSNDNESDLPDEVASPADGDAIRTAIKLMKEWESLGPSDDLLKLTIKLERANLAFDSDPENPRAAVLQALQAVVEFLGGELVMEKANYKPYLWRPLELLFRELSQLHQLRSAPKGMILPPYDGGAAGVNRRRVINELKGEAAFAAEQLVRAKMTRRAAAAKTLEVLKRHGFSHGVRRKDEVEGFLRTIKRYKKEDSPAAKRYRALCSQKVFGDPLDEHLILMWLVESLYLHGFIKRT